MSLLSPAWAGGFFATSVTWEAPVNICTCFLAQFISVSRLCPTLCDPMDCSTPGFPVHHQLPELTQTNLPLLQDGSK